MNLFSLIQSIPSLKVKKDEPLSKYTTWRVGGPADFFVEADNRDGLLNLIKLLQKNDVPYFLLGGGSNILVSDSGFKGIIIKLGKEFKDYRAYDNTIIAGCALSLRNLSNKALASGLSGLEFAHDIPGTLGGAIKVNAGAFGEDISRIMGSVDILDAVDLTIRKITPVFGYRASSIDNSLICIEAELILQKMNMKQIKSKIEKLSEQRKVLQPGGFSTGSVFKNPDNMFAGELIEAAGCKSVSIGDARVSEKHANFIITNGKTKAKDILSLIQLIREKVYNSTGIILETEIIPVGFVRDEITGFREKT